jgi:hypothetical protein
MDAMRALILFAAAALATPAFAQDPAALTQLQLDALRAEQSLAQLRAINEANERMALEARLKAQQALLDLQLQRVLPPQVPTPPYPGAGPTVTIDPAQLPSIPDAALAESNRRVRETAKTPR